jgi:hypothetical protein
MGRSMTLPRIPSDENKLLEDIHAFSKWIQNSMDPLSFGCPGSGLVLGIQIRIQEHGNVPKLQINLVFCLLKRLLYLGRYVF